MTNKQEREAFEAWRETQPYGGATAKQEAAFISGYRAALAPKEQQHE